MKSTYTLLLFSVWRKACLTGISLLTAAMAYSFTLLNFADPAGKYPLVIIPDSLQQNLSKVYLIAGIASISPGQIYTTTFYDTISLTDTTYFQYLGEVVLDPTDTANSARFVYRFIYTGYTEISGNTDYIQMNMVYDSLDYAVYGAADYPCLPYNQCPSRYMMLNLYEYLFNDDPLQYPGYGGAFDSLTTYQQQMTITVLNWDIMNSTPTVSDYSNVLNPAQEVVAAAPTDFCTDSSETHTCSCLSVMQDTMQSIDAALKAFGGYDSTRLGSLLSSLQFQLFFECFCSSNYYIFMYGSSVVNAYLYVFIPAKAWLPTMEGVVVFGTDTVYTALGYAYNATQEVGMTYTGSGQFTYSNGFAPFNYSGDSAVSITPGGPSSFCLPDSVVLTLAPTDSTNIVWNNGDTTFQVAIHSSGSYSAIYTNPSACILHSDTITVTLNGGTQLSDSDNNGFACASGNVGFVQLSLTGGTGPFTFAWSNSDTSQNIDSLAPGKYTVIVTDTHGCADTLSDSLSCSVPCMDSLVPLCTNMTPVLFNNSPQNVPFNFALWSFDFNYSGSNGSTVNITPAHSILIGYLVGTANNGFNQNLVIAATLDSSGHSGYSYDTLLISVIDSLTGDTCNASLSVHAADDSSYYLPACNPTSNTISNAQIQCVQTPQFDDQYNYMATLTINNNFGSSEFYGMLYMPGCSNYSEMDGGVISPGSVNDTVYFQSDSLTQDSATFIYVMINTVTLCPICQIPFTIQMPPPLGTLQFTAGDTVLCAGDTGCYQASAANSEFIYYALDSGGASIDSATGCVSNVTSSFMVMAIAQGALSCVVDTAYLQVNVSKLQLSATNYFYCASSDSGDITLSASGGFNPLGFVWSDGATTQSISSLPQGNYAVTVTDAHGCKASLSDSLSCTSLDSLAIHCITMEPYPGIDVEVWSFSFDYSGSDGSTLLLTAIHSYEGGELTSTVKNGYNKDAGIQATFDNSGFTYDTILVSVIDSLTGDTSSLPVQLYIANDSSYYFPTCDSVNYSVTPGVVQCIQTDSSNGLPYYMVPVNINNYTGAPIMAFMPSCPNCNNSNDNGGMVLPGSFADNVYFEPDSMNQDSVSFIYLTLDTNGCALCAIPLTIAIPQLATLQFTAGETVLCAGDTSCYQASAANSQFIYYAIDSGGASIDSASGCISNVTGNFTVMAIAHGAGCVVDTNYRSVRVPQMLPPSTPSAQQVCSDSTYTFTIFDTASRGNANQIEWALNANFSSSTIILSPAIINIVASSGTIDSIWIRSRDSVSGCTSGAVITTATVNPFPVSVIPTADQDTICPGTSTVINIPNTILGQEYDLKVGSVLTNSEAGYGGTLSIYSPRLDTTSIFEIFVTNSFNGCITELPDLKIFVKGILSNPIFNAGASVLCIGDTSTYIANAANASSMTYSTYGGGANIDQLTGFVSGPSSNFVVVASATGINGCGYSQSAFPVTVPQIGLPQAPLIINTCSDTPTTVPITNIKSGYGGNEIEWSSDNLYSVSYILPSSGNISVSLDTGQSMNLWIRSKDSTSGCVSSSIMTNVVSNTFPNASIFPSDTALPMGDSILLQASGGVSYFWPDLQLDTPSVIIHLLPDSTMYSVVVSNKAGCKKKAKALVDGIDGDNYEILITNAFTADLCGTLICTTTVAYSATAACWATLTLDIGPINYYGSNLIPGGSVNSGLEGGVGNVPIISNPGGGGYYELLWGSSATTGLLPGETYQFIYSVSLPCPNFSNGAPTLTQVFTLPTNFTFPLDCNNNQLPTFLVNGVGHSDASGLQSTLTQTIQPYPDITLSTTTPTINVVNGTSTFINLKVRNSGNAPYSGPLDFDCSSSTFQGSCASPGPPPTLSSIAISFPDGYTYTITNPTGVEDLNYDPNPLVNGPYTFGAGLYAQITETITVPCGGTDACADDLTLTWDACGTTCPQADNVTLTLQSLSGASHLSIARILPGPSPTDLIANPDQHEWDGTCMGSEQKWQYLIINDGQTAATDVVISLNNINTNLSNCATTYTYLEGSSNLTKWLPVNGPFSYPPGVQPFDPGSIVETRTFLDPTVQNSLPYLCNSETVGGALQSYSASIQSLAPGQYAILQFYTLRCCPSQSTVPLSFNTGADFNRWTINASYEDCSNGNATTNASPVLPNTSLPNQSAGYTNVYPPYIQMQDCNSNISNYISSQVIDGEPDLTLIQCYQPNVASLQGMTCENPPGDYPTHVCTGNEQLFQITNLVFSAWSGSTFNHNAASDWDSQLYTDYGLDNSSQVPAPTGDKPRGQFVIAFHGTPGTEFPSSSNDEPYISNPNPSYDGTQWWPIAGSYQTIYNSGPLIPNWNNTGISVNTGESAAMAVFDINDLCSGAINSCISNTSQNFRNFFINSVLNFNLQSYCPLPPNTANATMTVQTSFNPLPIQDIGAACIPYSDNNGVNSDACLIPLSSINFQVYLHCPGCITPGLSSPSYTILRDVTEPANLLNHTIGYEDNNNDGLPDACNMPPANNSNMKTGLGIIGDVFTGTIDADFVDGQVFHYSDLIANNAPFTYLYFEQDLTTTPAFDVGMSCLDATLTYTPEPGNGTPYTIILTDANLPLGLNFPVATTTCPGCSYSTFLFDEKVANLLTGAGSSGIKEGDKFTLVAHYQACNNPNTLDFPAGNIDITFNNYMYFINSDNPLSVSNTNPAPYKNYSTAGSDYQNYQKTYNETPTDYTNALYYCDARAGDITILPIISVFNENWTNNGSCLDTVSWQAGYEIANVVSGIAYPHAFPFEYRYVPWIAEDGEQNPNVQNGAELTPWNPSPLTFTLNVPAGYTASFLNTAGIAPLYNSGEDPSYEPLAAINQVTAPANVADIKFVGTNPSTGPSTVTSSVNLNDVQFVPPYSSSCYNSTNPHLFIGDEMFLQTMQFTLQRICSDDASYPVETTSDVSAEIPTFGSCSTPTGGQNVPANYSNIPEQELTATNPGIGSFGTPTYSCSNGMLTLTFQLNVGAALPSNLEFYFDQTSSFFSGNFLSLSPQPTMTATIGCEIDPLIQGTNYFVYQVEQGTLTPNTQPTFSLNIPLTSCPSITSGTFDIYYVWDCDGYWDPSSPPTSYCASPVEIQIPVDWTYPYNESCSNNSTFTTCQNNIYKFCLKTTDANGNVSQNAITPNSFNFEVPNNFASTYMAPSCVVSDNIINLIGPPTSETLYPNADIDDAGYNATFTSYSVSLGEYNVTINNGSEICVELNIVPSCSTTVVPPINYGFNFTTYCGTTIPQSGDNIYPYSSNSVNNVADGCDVLHPVVQINNVCQQNDNGVTVSVTQDVNQNPSDPGGTDISTFTVALTSDPTVFLPDLSDADYISSPLPVTNTWTFSNYNSGYNYTFTLTNDDGCQYSENFTPVQEVLPINFRVLITPPACTGAGYSASIQSKYLAQMNYNWYDGANYYGGSSLDGLTPGGNYTVTATYNTSTPTCELAESFVVPTSTTPSLTLGTCYTMTGCSVGTATVESVTGGTAPYTYSWENGSTNSSLINLSYGDHNVTVTDATGCTGTATITIPPFEFSLTPVGTLTSCGDLNGSATVGTTTTLSSCTGISNTINFTYNWNGLGTTSMITDLAAGDYPVTVTGNSCSLATTVTVGTDNAAFQVYAVVTNPNCLNGDAGSINASVNIDNDNVTYVWSSGGVTTETITGLTYTVGNIYSVTATSGTCTATTTASLADPLDLSVTMSGTGEGCSSGSSSDGSAICTVITGVAPFTYIWSTNPTAQIISSLTRNTLTNLTIGTYSVTVFDNNYCSTIGTYTVTNSGNLTETLTPSPVKCYGASTGSIAGSLSNSSYTYTWSDAETTSSITNLEANTYSVIVQDGMGCSVSASAMVTQPSAPLYLVLDPKSIPCYGLPGRFGLGRGEVTSTVSGGTSPYTYNWDGGDHVPDKLFASAGTYDLTVTDANNCTVSASTEVNAPSNPLAVTIGLENATCDGVFTGVASASGGTPVYSFQWSNNNNAVPNSYTDYNYVFPLTSGTVTVTVTDANNCTASTSASTSVLSVTLVVTNDACYGIADGGAQSTVSSGTAPYTYQWNNNSLGENLTNVVSGPYSVTVTDYFGCTASASIIIPPYCCSGEGDNSFIIGSDAGYPLMSEVPGAAVWGIFLINKTITVAGTLTIDLPYSEIANCNIVCLPGASIIVNNNEPLKIYNSTLQGCSQMWQGITVSGEATLQIYNSKIYDAEFGVQLSGNCNFGAMNTDFYDCLVGMYLTSNDVIGFTSTINQTFPMTGCWFGTSAAQLKQPFDGMGATLPANFPSIAEINTTMQPWTGIYLNNIHGFIIGSTSSAVPWNAFYNMSNGIIASNSEFSSYGNVFNDIPSSDYDYYTNFSNCGIYGFNNSWIDAELNSFASCSNGIVGNKVGVAYVQNNSFNEMVTSAVTVSNSTYSEIFIYNNYIVSDPSSQYGIELSQNDPEYLTIVLNNTIYDAYDANISISGGLNPPVLGNLISNNIIGGGSSVKDGIVLNSCAGSLIGGPPHAPWYALYYNRPMFTYQVYNNYVGFENDAASSLHSFEISQCNQIDAYGNTAYADNTTGIFNTAHKQAGYYFYNTIDVRSSCNTVTNNHIGVLFDGTNKQVLQFPYITFEGTTFNLSSSGTDNIGLFLPSTGTMEKQTYAGNIWPNLGYAYGSYAAKNIGSQQQIAGEIFWLTDPGCPYLPCSGGTGSVYPPSGWFEVDLDNQAQTFDCANTPQLRSLSTDTNNVDSIGNDSGSLSYMDTLIMNDSLSFPVYNETLVWQSRRILYDKLTNNPALRPIGSVADSFYATMLGTAAANFTAIEEAKDLAWHVDSVTTLQLSLLLNQRDSLLKLRLTIDSSFYNNIDSGQAIFYDSVSPSLKIATVWMSGTIMKSDIPVDTNWVVMDTAFAGIVESQLLNTWKSAKQALQNSLAYIDSSISELRNNSLSEVIPAMNSVYASNSAINDSLLVETNLKSLNTIYLSTLAVGVDTFSSSQLTQLRYLAYQCPLMGGEAVMRARSLLTLVDTIFLYPDDSLCDTATSGSYRSLPVTSSGSAAIKGLDTAQIVFTVYPNPASDYLIIQCNKCINGVILLKVMDLTGQVISDDNINLSSGLYILDTKKLASGMYILRLVNDSQLFFTTKFTIFSR